LILFVGLLVYYVHVNRFRYVILACVAMAGAVMVSYAKARAASLVAKTSAGFWERPERLVLMILGALFDRMPLVLWILAIGSNITVVHRIIYTWKQTKAASPEPGADPAHDSTHTEDLATGHDASRYLARTAGRGQG